MSSMFIREKYKNPAKAVCRIFIYSLNIMGIMIMASFGYFFYRIKAEKKFDGIVKILMKENSMIGEQTEAMVMMMIAGVLLAVMGLLYITLKYLAYQNELRVYNIQLMYVLGHKRKSVCIYELGYIFSEVLAAVLASVIMITVIWHAVGGISQVQMLQAETGLQVRNLVAEAVTMAAVLMLVLLVTYINVCNHYSIDKNED